MAGASAGVIIFNSVKQLFLVFRLSFTSPDARVWTYVIEAVGKFAESGVFILKPEAMHVKAIDPSRTAMIEFIIPKEAFEEYVVSDVKAVYLSMEELSRVLESAESNDKLRVMFSEGSVSVNFSDGIITRVFKTPLHAEIAHEEIPELELQYLNEYVVSGDVLYDALVGVERFGDVLRLSGNESTLTLRSVGDLGEAEVVLSVEKGTLRDARVGNPGFEVSFSLDYITYLKKPIKASEEVVVRADNDLPIHLELRFPSGSKLNYYVAPRAE